MSLRKSRKKHQNRDEMLERSVMFPVVSANSEPTQTCSLRCVCLVVSLLLHTCVGVRPPLESVALSEQLMKNRRTPVGWSQQQPIVCHPKFHASLFPWRGSIPCSDSGWNPSWTTSQSTVTLRTWFLTKLEVGFHRRIRGAQSVQDVTPSAWDDSTSNYLFPGKTSTSPLSHEPTWFLMSRLTY